MKTLPDNPDLGHLRRQAKDLLAGMREARPEVTLGAAQTALAEQYGFAGWTELKAEVDRSQGNAEVAGPELAKLIAAAFGLGAVDGPMRSLSRPDESGRRWVLPTVRGRWTARTVDDVFPVTDGEENARFQEAAAEAGVVLPAPVRSVDGRVVEEIAGQQWRVYAWVRTGPPLIAPVSYEVAFAAGRTLAVLHGLKFPADRVCPWSSMRLSPTSHPDLVPLESIEGEPGDPVMCHNNLNPGNVRRGEGGRPVVTGWEHAAGLPPDWELCSALVSWGNPGAVADGYRAEAGALPPLTLGSFRGTATATLNYVGGQLELARNATGEDRRFAERSVRHLLANLPSRELYEKILDTVG